MNSLKESDKRVTVMEREHSNGDSDFFLSLSFKRSNSIQSFFNSNTSINNLCHEEKNHEREMSL